MNAHQSLRLKLERGAAQARRGELIHPNQVFKTIANLKRARAKKKQRRSSSS